MSRRRVDGGVEACSSAYPSDIDALRATEFPLLDDLVYLDHAGATLFTESQLTESHNLLRSTVYGNPHSQNPASATSTAAVERMREKVLAFFGTSGEDYAVVFTSGATHSCRLVAEAFPWTAGSQYVHTSTNHNSVLGVREVAAAAGASVSAVHPADVEPWIAGLTSGATSDGCGSVGAPTLVTSTTATTTTATTTTTTTSTATTSTTTSTPTITTNPLNTYMGGTCPDGLGVGEAALGAPCSCADSYDCDGACGQLPTVHSLFAYPASCNFSGTKFPLDAWIAPLVSVNVPRATDSPGDSSGSDGSGESGHRWHVLLDAASYVATNRLDLSVVQPSFVCLSFYKMFGYPTGLGALLVRRDVAHLLSKTYFGGGTVEAATASAQFHVSRANVSQRLEDGTVSFLSIAAIAPGLALLNSLGMENIAAHTRRLADRIADGLGALRHSNGEPVCEIYRLAAGDSGSEAGTAQFGGLVDGRGSTHSAPGSRPGSIVALNFLEPSGDYVGYSEVERLAGLSKIALRTGCFCNPGACEEWLGLSAKTVRANHAAGHVCWDAHDIVNGKPTGAVRLSVGYMNTDGDVDKVIEFAANYFVDRVTAPDLATTTTATAAAATPITTASDGSVERSILLEEIVVFPIKSCAGISVTEWELGPRGLLFDRAWVVVDDTGDYVNQKKAPLMCQIKPRLSLERRTLTLTAPGMPNFVVDIDDGDGVSAPSGQVTVCGECVEGEKVGGGAADWLSRFLGRTCRLVRQSTGTSSTRVDERVSVGSSQAGTLSFANESQCLLINRASVESACESVRANPKSPAYNTDYSVPASRFRGNLVVSGAEPFEEDQWTVIRVGGQVFKAVEPCARCTMICIDQDTGEKQAEPLLTLFTYRRHGTTKKVVFGVHLFHDTESSEQPFVLRCGEALVE